MRKPLLLIGLAALAAGLAWLLQGQMSGPEALRSQLAGIGDLRRDHPVAVAGAFCLAYVAVTALSLPIAIWLTLAGGALFGFWQGLVIVSFASALGATLAFLAARYLLRDWVRARLGDRAEAVDEGLRRDGAFSLFSMRLIPVVPFFAINLLMGLSPMRARTFYGVSQLGMLPATAVTVNAGTQLAALDSLSGILSPPILASFAALALLPWVARAGLALWRMRAITSGWTRPRRFDRNLVVIGAGAAGLVSAYVAAAAQARVTLVEAHAMGGDCLNTSCVPSKALIRSAALAHQMRHASHWGLTDTPPVIPFADVIARVDRIIADIAPHDSVARYRGLGVEVLQGRARLTDPWTVQVTAPDGSEQRLTTRAVILATGAQPVLPPVPGLDLVDPLTSETLWDRLRDRDQAPRRLVVLGGGAIGCELAQAFARLGSRVTQIEIAPRLLAREDPEVSAQLQDALQAEGVRVLTGRKPLRCGVDDGGRWIEIDGAPGRIPFDEILVAVGRRARLSGLGLEALGIPTDMPLDRNDFLETRFPHILAAGDVAGPWQLTHAAAHQGGIATANALLGGLWRLKATGQAMPQVIFTDPQIARIGLSQTEARDQGIPHEVTRHDLAQLDRAVTEGAARGMVTVLTPPGKDRILGVTIMGGEAGEMIAPFALAMRHRLGLSKILGTIHAYPTWAEAGKATAGSWRRAHVSPRALSLAARFHRWRRG
ncbi:pyridine nucleotide-disulfide oxidoreductase [Paracoccus gahaiensis]|uniref:Pyridine nucleotide-disulfide oxidoreductase n=1 Tax=Paracoccus gahaiensis TaxID=1706839 RepID=A0A4U0RAW7_9RHOB|nr:bifunctional TVP38/TMEM64 family protein/FAD-dependent oxidoreductase [Paracoccus gahaiensis]TJZ91620.1 pyridine nucleotide-disulfide oxidoreductase [Paracoccus gahaiensis]